MYAPTVVSSGARIRQDADAKIVRRFDLDDWFDTASAGQVVTATFAVSVVSGTSVTPMTVDQDTIVSGGRQVQFRTQGGTVGVTYRVTLHFVTNETPPQEDDAWVDIVVS